MPTAAPRPIRLDDYRPPDFAIETIELEFDLDPGRTRVSARLAMRRTGPSGAPLSLSGERLKLLDVRLDGASVSAPRVAVDQETLTLLDPPDVFTLETVVEIDPQANAALEGLYMSAGRFCTQCEAEGFRKITYFLDRPDVLARYRVRINAPPAYPRLLSNGNLVASGVNDDGRLFAVWEDPFPKPSYLFALVAGELDVLEDRLVTGSGRTVELKIYVDPGQSGRALYAMDALKRAMVWDEVTFGREYDLDLFMIVAVRDFNFGAMENKGLNIFNSSLLLADPETATDLDYERIESVVAHEYFHNWTGNRITCRDWFQLCLKEGLTVYRDQLFSADMRGDAVQRIKDVRALRARQFAEDAGPLAHPVRPSAYVKIDNFYTATIYEKGAELIRMLRLVVGGAAFKQGMDLYFTRWDGQAATVEAFIACFEEASGRPLEGFFAWYEQAGTPELGLTAAWSEASKTVTLEFTQATRPTPEQPNKVPLPVPVRLGMMDADGRPLGEERLILVTEAAVSVELPAARRPIVSALRGFSAPVILKSDTAPRDLYVQMAFDEDLFNRWEAAQILARRLIIGRAKGAPDEVGEERFADAAGRALQDQAGDSGFKALFLALPAEGDLAVETAPADPQRLHDARNALRARLSAHLEGLLFRTHSALHDQGPFRPDAASAGRRALRNACLDLLAAQPTEAARARAAGHYAGATNMTDMMGGLNALMLLGGAPYEDALSDFYQRWRHEPLVIDKWFALQARTPAADALDRVLALSAHPDFDGRNPNRLRALILGFASGNPAQFHDPSGKGYRFLADQILMIDAFNPSLAAKLIEPLGAWGRYAGHLAGKMQAELRRIAAHEGLSRNVEELATKALEG